MAQLIDYILVILAVAAAIWYTLKYFYNLGKKPESESISCSGCNSGCHADLPASPSSGLPGRTKKGKSV